MELVVRMIFFSLDLTKATSTSRRFWALAATLITPSKQKQMDASFTTSTVTDPFAEHPPVCVAVYV